MDFILQHETALRLASFLGGFLLFVLLERGWPQHAPLTARGRRWISNLSLSVFNSLCLKWALPLLASGAALWAQTADVGLFHWLSLPPLASALITLLILDLAIYLQHVAFHHIPWLWQLHKVHHTDLDLDVTTGVRFHPLEILLSMLYKITIVVLLGANPVIVILFEIQLNSFSLFTHSNLRLPAAVDRPAQWLLVTPNMHRIHHSVRPVETNSNFGFTLSLWDRLFGLYRPTVYAAAQTSPPDNLPPPLILGLAEYRQAPKLNFINLLLLPFRSSAT